MFNWLKLSFIDIGVIVFRRSDDSIAFKSVLKGKFYLVDFLNNNVQLDACLIAKTNMGWLWHHQLAHVGMKNLHKLLKGEHILGLTNVCFEKDRPCAACQAGKQVGTSHHTKNVMIHQDHWSYCTWIYSTLLLILASERISMVVLLMSILDSLGYVLQTKVKPKEP
jgi:hypothetical protein